MAAGPDNVTSGFTLVETLVVLAIAALVFSVGALGLSVLKGRETPVRTAQDIARVMMAVRADAFGEGPRSVVIDLEAKRILGPADGRMVRIPGDYAISVIVGKQTVADDKRPEVHFLPDGTSSGAEIVITAPDGERARVDVNWLTGLARVSDGTR